MPQYEVKIAMTLSLLGKLTVAARDARSARTMVQMMIASDTFQITDWRVETNSETELDEVQGEDHRIEIESVEEVP